MSRKALGRGLRALIPEPVDVDEPEGGSPPAPMGSPNPMVTSTIPRGRPAPGETASPGASPPRDNLRYIPIDMILPNPRQPRQTWESGELKELTQSILSAGLLEPIILRPAGDHYEIVAGERRWRACKIAKWTEIPAIVRTMEEQESLAAALVENVQRADLNAVEEARAYEVLISEYGLTHDDIATRVGRSRSAVTNLLRILQLSPAVLEHVSRGTLSAGHARVLLGIPEDQREPLAQRMAEESWSVRQAEEEAQRMTAKPRPMGRRGGRGQPKPESLRRLEEEMCRRFSSEVRIRLSRKGGRIEIRYHDDEDLSRLLEQLGIVVV